MGKEQAEEIDDKVYLVPSHYIKRKLISTEGYIFYLK